MKNNALVIMIICCIAIVCLFTGYFMNKVNKLEVRSGPITPEKAATVDWGEWEPREYPEFEWPTLGIATKIPVPDWSANGVVYINSENRIWVYVGYATYDIFEDYTEECKQLGYTEELYFKSSGLVPFFYAENEKGHAIKVSYITTDHTLSIDASCDASDYQKDWLEED